VRDYNGYDVETSTYLGNSTIEMIPGDELHYVFLFKTNGKPTRLDTGGVWSGKGSAAVGDTSVPASCVSHDAPYSVD
jgi:hypothetical protein